MTDLFLALVKTDSPSGHEREVAEFVAGFLADLGLESVIDESNNLYCRVGSGDSPLLICNHLDTVEPGRNIEPTIDSEGVIRSSGDTILGGDNKAGLAAALFALQSADISTLNLELLFTSREETDSGIKDFDMSRIQSQRAVIVDGGGGELAWLAAQAPTIIDFIFAVEGKASHSSRPQDGVSVLPFVSEMILDFKPGRIDENTTYNLGTLKAGDASNTVPFRLTIEGDIRSTDHQAAETFRGELDTYLRQLAKTHELKLKIKWNDYCQAYKIDTSTDFFKKVQATYESIGITLDPINTTSASDAAHLRMHRIEALCLGDGVKNPHERTEYIEVETLETLAQIFAKLIKEGE